MVAGVVSFTSPCTLPLLPGYLSYISGLSDDEESRSRTRKVRAALLFVLGFSTVFVALGTTASALGLALAQNLRAINIAGGAVIVLMGLTVTGLVRIPLFSRQLRFDLTQIGRGPAGAFPLGAAFAFGWTPCVGPVLASILATAATTATVSRGAVMLLAYSAGLGLPFLLLALGFERGNDRLGWLRRHSRHIEIGGGVLLVAMGIAVMTGDWTRLMSDLLAVYARLGWPPI
ncbi:cytochrome c biogenesis CcdA family protein [Lentzea sp. HUAS TT2]|uniref:cytochrome c biogenesis CcdA family protein n=1 Tax=Lentzea sp. HUAS TT2 TaxID=3447454 RepID=UPI003F703EA2